MKLKLFKGLMYILSIIVFIVLFRILLEDLRNTATLRFSTIHMLLYEIVFTLTISIVFSLKYIFSLFGQKVGLDVARIIMTLLLAIALFIHFLYPNIFVSDGIIPFLFPPQIIFAYKARTIMYFMLWYNLIYAFKTKSGQAPKP